MTDCTTAEFPEKKPAEGEMDQAPSRCKRREGAPRLRAKMTPQKVFERPIMTVPAAMPEIPMRITGLRPILSGGKSGRALRHT